MICSINTIEEDRMPPADLEAARRIIVRAIAEQAVREFLGPAHTLGTGTQEARDGGQAKA